VSGENNYTQKEMLNIILSEFKEYKKEWKEYKKEQREINKLVIRNDEKLKGVWRIPVISGGTVTLITGIAVLVIKLT
jgi:hypothetical protein